MAYAIQPITTTAALTQTRGRHANLVTVLDSTTGRIITLPASSGSGDVYTVYVKTTVSSGNHVVQVANSTDVMNGGVAMSTDIGGTNMLASATSDTVTMNGSTTGGLAGSWLRFTDVVAGFWMAEGFLVTTGTEATPWSAAV
jgi:hypothetical protein